ncbi:MAG: hypothetical protein ACI97A_000844 [Planctomycetota bacterium]|jgi:hypothetical protein
MRPPLIARDYRCESAVFYFRTDAATMDRFTQSLSARTPRIDCSYLLPALSEGWPL